MERHRFSNAHRDIRPKVMPQHKGKFLVLDIDTGDYEIDEEDLQAEKRLRSRRPDGVLYGLRIGYTSAYTLSGYIHILLVIAIVVVLIRVIQGRRAF